MATGTRIRQDFIEGTLISNLSTSATAMESDGLADLTVIDNATNDEYAAVVIGDEVVHVITHNSAATTAEIQRGQEGTTAAAHDAGAAWHHGPTEDDFSEMRPPTAKATREATAQSVPNITVTPIEWDTEKWDADGMVDVAGATPSRIVAQTAGKYRLTAGLQWAANAGGNRRDLYIHHNGAAVAASRGVKDGTNIYADAFSTEVELLVGDYIELAVYQDSGGALDAVAGPRTFLAVTKFSD